LSRSSGILSRLVYICEQLKGRRSVSRDLTCSWRRRVRWIAEQTPRARGSGLMSSKKSARRSKWEVSWLHSQSEYSIQSWKAVEEPRRTNSQKPSFCQCPSYDSLTRPLSHPAVLIEVCSVVSNTQQFLSQTSECIELAEIFTSLFRQGLPIITDHASQESTQGG
jgi:hypothetical protein